jgi:hypothetical protein
MILADITFKWKFDYEMCIEEQTWHEEYVDTFKFRFHKWLQNCGISSNYRIVFDLLYFPKQRKFYLQKISLREEIIFHNLKKDRDFFKLYFLDKLPTPSSGKIK